MRRDVLTPLTLSALTILPVSASALDAPLTWAAIEHGTSIGRSDCPPHDPACNRCTHDVVASFGRLDTNAVTIASKSVNYLNGVGLPPAAQAISEFSVKSHFQGFAHVDYDVPITQLGSDELIYGFGPPYYWPSPRNSTGGWYAHAFGPVRPNGISLSWRADRFKADVPPERRRQSSPNFYFQPPEGQHVGGLHGVGKYLLAAVDLGGADTYIAVFDLSRPLEMRWAQGQGVTKLPIGALGVERASSVAAAQLYDGSYLVAVQERAVYDAYFPWKPDLNKHSYSLFRVPSLDDPRGLTLLAQPRDIPFSGADNLSALTDCETREVFLVAAGGNDVGGPNYWTLLRATLDGLEVVDQGNSPDFDEDICQTRAAGAAFPNEQGAFVAACIEKSEGDGVAPSWDWQEWTPVTLGSIVQE